MTDKKTSEQAGYKKPRGYQALSYPRKRRLWGFIFLAPWLIGTLCFFMFPLIRTFYYSLFEMKLDTNGFLMTFKGIENYRYALMSDTSFNQYLLESLATVAKSVPFQIFISLFVAMMLNGKYPGRGFFRVVFFIPIILATGITEISITDVNIASQESQKFISAEFITTVLTTGGVPGPVMVFINTLVNDIFGVITKAGVQMLIFLAGLQSINPNLYEVAKIEGCSKFECFCKITLPMISPMILVCMVYSIADAFAGAKIAEYVNKVTFNGGGTKYGLGASMSAIYFVVSVSLTLICTFIVSKVVFYYDK